MADIGVCEDDLAIRKVLVEALQRAGHTVTVAHNGAEALSRFAAERRPEVVILDIGLPDADGRDVCLALRSRGQLAPVLFLTARDTVHDIVTGFNVGADDYLTKPFAVAEVVVRVEALLRRTRPLPEHGSDLTLDPVRFTVRHGEASVALTPTEFRMLAVLAGRPGEVVRRRELVAAGWPDGAMVQENTIDSFVRRIRTKLGVVGSVRAVETVRGVGYVLR